MPRYSARRDPKVIRKVLRLAKQGRSCREIAKAVGFSRTIVSQIAKDKGHTWGSVNTKRANEARAAYDAERRSGQVLRLAGRIDDLTERMGSPTVAFSFGGRDNVYAEHSFETPDSRTLLDLARAQGAIAATMKILHNFDVSDAGDLGAVDDYLAKAKGGS